MKVIKITDERINAILPKSIKDSDVLSNNDKKVLGAILHYFLILDKAKENKYIILTNENLRKTVCIRNASVLSSVQNLIEMKLIKRECGKTRKEGEKSQASKYYVNWNNLKKPLKKLEFEDLFSDFISSEKPSGTVDIDTVSDTDIDTVSDTVIDEDTVPVIDIDKDIAPACDVTEVTLQENNKIKNINIKTSEDITPDDGTLQDDEVENVFLNNSDDDWLSYELERSMMGEVNNDLKLNNMKKENEMSDNGTNAMNAISEQSERQARENESSESGTINEMTTSTSGDKNKTSKEFQNIPVDKSKVINNDCNVQDVIPNAKDCAPAPATEEWKPIAWDEDAIFGSGEPQNVSGDKLPTNEEKTQPEPQECPQNEFNRERMLDLFKISAKETVLERFKEQLKEMDAYMQHLKKNDHFTYEIYLKEIFSWWNNPMNVWNSDFDFICVGNDFKRKYVA